MLSYPHRLRITAPRTGGSARQSRVTSNLTPEVPADEVLVYEGAGDMQDSDIREGRPEDGARVVVANGRGFLANETGVGRLAPMQVVRSVDVYGRERVAVIVAVSELDGSFTYLYRRTSLAAELAAVG